MIDTAYPHVAVGDDFDLWLAFRPGRLYPIPELPTKAFGLLESLAAKGLGPGGFELSQALRRIARARGWMGVAAETSSAIVLGDDRRYDVPHGPIQVAAWLAAMSEEHPVDNRFLARTIRRIAAARRWSIHPY